MSDTSVILIVALAVMVVWRIGYGLRTTKVHHLKKLCYATWSRASGAEKQAALQRCFPHLSVDEQSHDRLFNEFLDERLRAIHAQRADVQLIIDDVDGLLHGMKDANPAKRKFPAS